MVADAVRRGRDVRRSEYAGDSAVRGRRSQRYYSREPRGPAPNLQAFVEVDRRGEDSDGLQARRPDPRLDAREAGRRFERW